MQRDGCRDAQRAGSRGDLGLGADVKAIDPYGHPAGPAVSGEARCGARPLAILTTVMIGEGGT
ncbi:hypothetical protein SAM40697_0236 [Streptomyces ambofaciens]|uniref:Uncharacterized protein n=1 Tax=Streptomyces ambofaciens TaxID=1889 RepID=A0ABN4NYY4_STRAM|nr:hypothetical protein SAM40697_0236 [Streptomyces ambofaciens]